MKPKVKIDAYRECFRSSSGDKCMIDIVLVCSLDVGERGGWRQHV